MNRRTIHAHLRGRTPYARGLLEQEQISEALRRGEGDEHLLLLEHDPVVTQGSSTLEEHLRVPAPELRRRGIELYECGRGGAATYHGPGQLVGYPIVSLAPDRKDCGRYLRDLEETLIRTLADYGIEGRRIEGKTGVWVDDAKIAAIGVRVSRWVTSHGFALNVAPDLNAFSLIVPCGIEDCPITSLERLLDETPSLEDVARRYAEHFSRVFERELSWVEPRRSRSLNPTRDAS